MDDYSNLMSHLNEKEDMLYFCEHFEKWTESLHNYNYVCSTKRSFNSCDTEPLEITFKISGELNIQDLDNNYQRVAEYLEFMKFMTLQNLKAKFYFHVACAGIKEISNDMIDISLYILISNDGKEKKDIYDEIEKTFKKANFLLINSKIKEIKFNNETVKWFPPYLPLGKSVIQKTDQNNEFQSVINELDNGILLLDFTTDSFNDTGLDDPQSMEFHEFSTFLSSYLIKNIGMQVPFILNKIEVLSYSGFKIVTGLYFHQLNTLSFRSLNTLVDEIPITPFEYKNQNIALKHSSKLYATNLCSPQFLSCQINSFCYQLYANAFCLCNPGFTNKNNLCITSKSIKNVVECLPSQEAVLILNQYYCIDKVEDDSWIIPILILIVVGLIILTMIGYLLYKLIYLRFFNGL